MRLTGKVHNIDHVKKFGFIHVAHDATGYFFHRNDTERFETLAVGDSVTFEPVETERGPRAEEVAT